MTLKLTLRPLEILFLLEIYFGEQTRCWLTDPGLGPNKLIEEFKSYLNEPNFPMEVAINLLDAESDVRPTKPLEFWKNASIRFPLLSEIGRDAVSVTASSGSIERSFSTATNILSTKRSRMKPDLFARLMFIKCNSKLTWPDAFMSKK